MDLIDYETIRAFYNEHNDCWSKDLFSVMTTTFIDKYVNKVLKKFDEHTLILNAGSGGKCYTTKAVQYHLDIAENTLKYVKNAFVGNITQMPFDAKLFDCVVCVGTVINYCEASKVIQEISRVSKKNSFLILEYERNESGLIEKNCRKLDCSLFFHTYFSEQHCNFLYSDRYIEELLKEQGYTVIKSQRFNTTIPLFEMFTSEKTAHKMTFLEPVLRNLPIINSYSHNRIIVCKKSN